MMKKALMNIKRTFQKLNFPTKVLLFISLITLIETVLIVFFNQDCTSPSEITIRSTMSSIFGYFFGQQCKKHYNILDYNSQVYFAAIVAIICLFAIILMTWLPINQTTASSTEVRNLLLTTVGFLISMVRNNDD